MAKEKKVRTYFGRFFEEEGWNKMKRKKRKSTTAGMQEIAPLTQSPLFFSPFLSVRDGLDDVSCSSSSSLVAVVFGTPPLHQDLTEENASLRRRRPEGEFSYEEKKPQALPSPLLGFLDRPSVGFPQD